MESIFLGLAILACPVGMGLMMWFMAKGMGGKKEDPATVEQMRAEQQRLATQVEQLERERSADEVPAH
ncbi:MAG: hypothetical protein ABIZ50_01790 [Solirubrobacterales bacterium]